MQENKLIIFHLYKTKEQLKKLKDRMLMRNDILSLCNRANCMTIETKKEYIDILPYKESAIKGKKFHRVYVYGTVTDEEKIKLKEQCIDPNGRYWLCEMSI